MNDYDLFRDLMSEIGRMRSKARMAEALGHPGMAEAVTELTEGLSSRLAEVLLAEAKRERSAIEDGTGRLALPPEERPEAAADALDPAELSRIIKELLSSLARSMPRPPPAEGQGGESGGDAPQPAGQDGGEGPEDGGKPGGKDDCCCTIAILIAIMVFVFGGGATASASAGAKASDKKKLPGGTCVYVQGETTVSFWSRALGNWVTHDFGEEVLGVETGKGGVLAFSKSQAVVFDCELGIILSPLKSTDPLKKGGIKADE